MNNPEPLSHETLDAWRQRMANASPELEQLHRLLAAVEHYQRMGWLVLPEHERWKLEQLLKDSTALVGNWR